MSLARCPIASTLLVVVAAAPFASRAHAQEAATDTATVVIRLGTDTVAVERWVRTADRLEATHVARSPRTQLRRYSLRFDADGRVTRVTTATDDARPQERAVTPAGAVPLFGGLYAPYAVMLHDAWRAGESEATVRRLVGGSASPVTIRHAAAGEYALENQFGAPMTARLDERGRLLAIEVEGGTSVERVRGLNVSTVAATWRAQDERGEGMGPLSPRESVAGSVAGIRITIEYGRPAARGRQVWGGLVPYREVWRTGANEETLLTIGAPIRIGDLQLDAGTYSIFTVPGRQDWELIINRQTGQGGLGHDPRHDVGRVRMQVRTLDTPVERFTIGVREELEGGTLRMSWERIEASVPIRLVGR
jgi:hypothetical protein